MLQIVSFFSAMPAPAPSESSLLKAVLEPLLDDFQDWFGRSRAVLERESLGFLSPAEQADLLARVCQAQQEVSAAQMLFRATGEQVGVSMSSILPWHSLVTECWQVAMRFRIEQAGQNPTDLSATPEASE